MKIDLCNIHRTKKCNCHVRGSATFARVSLVILEVDAVRDLNDGVLRSSVRSQLGCGLNLMVEAL